MSPAVSVAFFRPEFNDFLYASIGADGNEMPLSVLSALARLDIDPWEKAAELAELPRDTATRSLASLLARLPGQRWAQTDSTAAADLIDLLPSRGSSRAPSIEKTYSLRAMLPTLRTRALICAGLGLLALLIAASREPSSQGDRADPPPSHSTSPPQTSQPTFR